MESCPRTQIPQMKQNVSHTSPVFHHLCYHKAPWPCIFLRGISYISTSRPDLWVSQKASSLPSPFNSHFRRSNRSRMWIAIVGTHYCLKSVPVPTSHLYSTCFDFISREELIRSSQVKYHAFSPYSCFITVRFFRKSIDANFPQLNEVFFLSC